MPLRIWHKWLAISAGLLFTMTAHAHEISAPETARHMFQAAETLNWLGRDPEKYYFSF